MKNTVEITTEQYEEYLELKHADEILERIERLEKGGKFYPLEDVEKEVEEILNGKQRN